jgi:hypothetical protein
MEALDVPLFDCGRYRRLGHSSWRRRLLNCAGFAHTRAPFQVRDFPAGKATIMNEPFTEAATRPSSTEHGEVPVQTFVTHPARFGFDAQ